MLKLNTKILKKAKKTQRLYFSIETVTGSYAYLGTRELLGKKLSTKFNI